jgi:hypothetical protein
MPRSATRARVGLAEMCGLAVAKGSPTRQLLWHSEHSFIGYNTA